MAFERILQPFDRLELQGVGWKFFQMKPRVGVLDGFNCGALVNQAVVLQEDDMVAQVAQQGPQEFGHVGSSASSRPGSGRTSPCTGARGLW